MRPLPLFIILLLISIVAFMVRLPFLHEPVDRDTGFFAIVGKYMHEGVALYRNVIDNKPPGIFLAFFILSVFFKPTLFIVKLFVLFVAIMSAILIYFLTNEIFTKKAAYLASFIFTVFSSSPFIEGNQAMIENFMLPFVLMGIILFIKYVKKQNALFVILSGIFLGIGFIFKQVVLFDFVAVTFYMFLLFIFFQRRHSISVLIKHYILLTVAFFTPFVIAIAYFNLKGALKDFIFSVFTFNVNYIKLLGYGQNSYWGKFFYFNSEIFKRFSFLCLAGMIFIILAFSAKMKKEKSRIYWVFLAIWALCVFLGICLSGRFFPHYYITLVPILSIMSAQLILITIGSMQSKRIHFTFFFIAVCLLISLAFSFFQQYKYYFVYTADEVSMNIYPWQPFVEAREIGRYIKKHTDPRDYVYVWAEEPEIFFYSERRSIDRYWKNTPFIYFSSFFPDAPIEVITLLKNKRPKYIVVDTRHIEALRYFKEIGDFIQKDYVIEAEFKVIRDKIWGYSLLAFRIKETS